MTLAAPTRVSSKTVKIVKTVAIAALFIVGLTVLLLLLAGLFTAKVPDDKGGLATSAADVPVAPVRLLRRPRYETAVGTVRAIHEAALASKILARVVAVNVRAGQRVGFDEVLVRLDDADLQARLKQSEAEAVAALAGREQADADFDRAEKLLATKAVSLAEFDRARAAKSIARAALERAEQAVREAKVVLGYATIRSPMNGTVVDRRIEVGDTAKPGQTLLTLYDPGRLQMIVTVREALAQRLRVGQKIPAHLAALGHDCLATVSEIVPEAQAESRSFTVKVTGPCPPGVYTGMFGRISIPLEEESVLVVPAKAIDKIGQLDMVDVVVDGSRRRRHVQLGRLLDQEFEVLAGLKEGELVVVPADGKRASP